ncbi:MAG: sulfonate transport system permease protein [Hyphomicrobiales bacterium]|jgi:NitT/TauT family transport system permease protein|nr:sulfonate transport system permease protein [Hyphomicrobiales bacterium]
MSAPNSQRWNIAFWRCVVLVVLLSGWELYGQFVDDTWFSRPSLIFARIIKLTGEGLAFQIVTTFAEMLAGLLIGVPLGTLLGLILGRLPVIAGLVRPIIFGLYSIPLVTLAPLFIFWFGLGLTPKVILVALVTFFLLFFTTFAGVQTIDREMIDGYRLLGATRAELLRKLIGPACIVWILSGLKLALPYALIAAVVGEMLLARAGLGYLLMSASQQIDMTGLYASLIILMVAGVLVGESVNWVERRVLRWRTVSG